MEQIVKASLTGDPQKNALELAVFMRKSEISCIRETGGYWADKIYFNCRYKNQSVCYIAINENNDNSWYVTGDDSGDNWHENAMLDERMKAIAWEHVSVCEKEDRCFDGCIRSNKIIFGKAFDSVCPIIIKFDNPNAADVECMKAVFTARKNYILQNNEPVIYRLANTGDAPKLAFLLWEQITEFDQADTALKDGYIDTCHSHIKHRLGKDLFCFVAEKSGLIVSHIFILITQKLPKLGRPNASYARLSSVRTVPEYRNKGIGSALMDCVKTFCKEKGAEEIIVWPSEKSVGYYKGTGFRSENKLMEIDFF